MLDAPAVRRCAAAVVRALAAARADIDALNVFPVADSDTGTNLYLTADAAVRELVHPPSGDPIGDLHALTRGALLGARGNSGVILSQLLRGAVAGLVEQPAGSADDGGPATAAPGVHPDQVRAALERAAQAAYAAVGRPVEGTMLSVIRAAADAARDAHGSGGSVLADAADAAREAVARTPEQLPVLAAAGVVDAGGRGLSVLLDAVLEAALGPVSESVPEFGLQTEFAVGRQPAPAGFGGSAGPPPVRPGSSPVLANGPDAAAVPGAPAVPAVPATAAGGRANGPAFEVMYLVDTDDDGAARLKALLAQLGESVLVVGGDGLWNAHVHLDDAGAAVEAGVQVGRPHRIRVTQLTDPGGGPGAAPPADPGPVGPLHPHSPAAPAPAPAVQSRVVVVVLPDPGLATLARACGAVVVDGCVETGQARAAELIRQAVELSHPDEVVLLAGDRTCAPVTRAAAEHARAGGARVAVIPTHARVQVLAALAVHDRARPFDDDVVAMTAAARATRHGAVTVAVGEALTSVGVCRPGDVLGLVEDDVACIGVGVAEVAVAVLDRMLSAGGELVTLVLGADAPADLPAALSAHLRRRHPQVQAQVHEGGQHGYPLLLGVE